jgi:hypothetical protein
MCTSHVPSTTPGEYCSEGRVKDKRTHGRRNPLLNTPLVWRVPCVAQRGQPQHFVWTKRKRRADTRGHTHPPTHLHVPFFIDMPIVIMIMVVFSASTSDHRHEKHAPEEGSNHRSCRTHHLHSRRDEVVCVSGVPRVSRESHFHLDTVF